MPLVNLHDMLGHAYAHRYAVAAFGIAGLEFLAGCLEAAERSRAPVIFNVPAAPRADIDPELLLPAVEAAARRAQVPTAIHFDHAATLGEAVRGIRLGANGVMIDSSRLPLSDHLARTIEVVAMAKGCGVPVEAALGLVPDAAAAGELRLTTVEEARAFVQRTGADFLAVSVGTAHGRPEGKLRLDTTRLRQINEALGIPLVIHGGTGLEEAQVQRLVAHGVAKINLFTALDEAAWAALGNHGKGLSQRLRGVRQAVAGEAERYIRWCGAAGRAAEVLAQCRPWEPVEHLILYNLSRGFEHQAEALMALGREVLSAIPGVRQVVTGTAIKEDAKFKLCWLVRFVAPEVIASYRDHPAHLAFADRHFRPLAEDRISIDYRLLEGAAATPLERTPIRIPMRKARPEGAELGARS